MVELGREARGVVIRGAMLEDATRCAEVHVTSWRATYAELLPTEFWERWTVPIATSRWQEWIARGVGHLVAEVDGELVGFALAREGRRTGEHEPVRSRELAMLYVPTPWQGTGVGQALLDAALPPASPAQLWVAERNPRAIRFYERNGFRADGARDATEHNGIVAIRMVR